MVYQPPTGTRDLFPVDVAQKRWIEERLQQVFHRWGYQRIITSMLERMDTLMAGGAIQRSTVIQLQTQEQEELGLRPELTASIARAAATRMAQASHPLRFYYSANVFRRSPQAHFNRQQESFQAGVELLGAGGVNADAEVLWLLSDCLTSLNLTDCYLVLGEAGLTRSLLSAFPEMVRLDVREAIANLDRICLEELPLSDELRERALLMLDLRGRPQDVLQRVSSLDLNPEQRQVVERLKSLVDLVSDQSAVKSASFPSLVLDLSLIQTFDYYTGIVFEVVSGRATGRKVVGQGGRYDQLLSLYHPQHASTPGIGFVFNLEDLQQALTPTGQLPREPKAIDWLVVPKDGGAIAAAFAHAQRLRQVDHPVVVEMELEMRQDADAVRQFARDRHIRQLAWVSADGAVEIEAIA